MMAPGFIADAVVCGTQQMQRLALHMQELSQPRTVGETAPNTPTSTTDDTTPVTPILDDKQQRRQKRHRSKQVAERPAVVRAASSATVMVLGAAGVYSGVRGILQGYQHLRRRLLRQLLAEVCPALDDLGVMYWADFGTLLGMYREKDVILHDNDADIVVLQPDWDLLLLQLQDRLPPHLKVYCVTPSEDPSIRWLRVSCGGLGIMDLYGGYDQGGENLQIPLGHGELCDLPRKLVLPLSRMHFRGYEVSVPGDVVGVLTYRYGKEFMVPRYMDKGRDSVEQNKLYARLLGLLARTGLCV